MNEELFNMSKHGREVNYMAPGTATFAYIINRDGKVTPSKPAVETSGTPSTFSKISKYFIKEDATLKKDQEIPLTQSAP